MNQNSPVFLIVPGYPVVAIPFKSFLDSLKDERICLNCKHFHQTEDWREVTEGFYLPKGECRANAPAADGFPKLHGGKHCGEFEHK